MKIKPIYITTIFSIFLLFYLCFFAFPEFFPLSRAGKTEDVKITQGESLSPVIVRIKLKPPTSNNQKAKLEVKEISFYAFSFPKDAVKYCVNSLVIMISGKTKNDIIKDFHKFPLEDQDRFCKSTQPVLPDPTRAIDNSILYNADDSDFQMVEDFNFSDELLYYPYDGFNLQLASFINLVYLDTNGDVLQEETLMPFFEIEPEVEINWAQTTSEPEDKGFWIKWLDARIMIQNGAATSITENIYLPMIAKGLYQPHVIQFSRPTLLKIIFPIIIFSFLAFIYLMTLVDSLELFFSGAIAVLVGLFGAREVLMPVSIAFGTLVDASILGLYVVFAISTIVQIFRFFPQLSHPDNKVQIPQTPEPSTNNPNTQSSREIKPPSNPPEIETPSPMDSTPDKQDAKKSDRKSKMSSK